MRQPHQGIADTLYGDYALAVALYYDEAKSLIGTENNRDELFGTDADHTAFDRMRELADANAAPAAQATANGNQHLLQGSFTKADGSTGQMEDLWFRTNNASTRQEPPLDVSAAIRDMPNL